MARKAIGVNMSVISSLWEGADYEEFDEVLS